MKYAAVIATVSAFASENYCPAGGACYTDSGKWNPTSNSVECTYDTNSGCIVPTCEATGVKATFSPNLFHVNEQNQKSFGDQIKAGDRDLTVTTGTGAGDVLSQTGQCPYSVDTSGNIAIDWSFASCSQYMKVELVNGKIVYTAGIQALGNSAENNSVIEFYIDTDAAASCSYPAEITVEKSFWINQEDVDASQNAAGDLDGEFDCKFFTDANLDPSTEINANNIVNMGVPIYGQVTSTALLGLSYELTDVIISNTKDTFSPIAGKVANSLVDAQITSGNPEPTGTDILFNYLSFGFEANSGTDQNQVSIQCKISLTVPSS